MNPKTVIGWIGAAVAILVVVVGLSSATYVVEPGHRGVEVVLGRVSPGFKPEGFGFKLPFITTITPQLIRQQTARMEVACYSADLQPIRIDVRVLYRVPEASVVALFRDYRGEVFESLVLPRAAEALNEVTALRSAEQIVQKREEVKSLSLDSARRKISEVVVIEDLVLENITLTTALESAIEAKMVQEQEAARARFAQQQAQTEASTVVIKAKGEAEAIALRGKALRENPSVLDLQIIEQWDGITPLVVGPGATGTNMMLPLGNPGLPVNLEPGRVSP